MYMDACTNIFKVMQAMILLLHFLQHYKTVSVKRLRSGPINEVSKNSKLKLKYFYTI